MAHLSWTPRDGETVHLHPANCWRLPAGRYTLRHRGQRAWDIVAASGLPQAVSQADLEWQHQAAILTPIGPAELARERQLAELHIAAPLRARRPQCGADGLALFDQANSPAML